MNQINIDSLLRIGSTQKPELQLRLDPSQLYQALLKIGSDDSARLQIQTPQGQLQAQIPVQVAQQVLQSTQQTLLTSTAVQTTNAGQPPQSQTTAAASQASVNPQLQTPTSPTFVSQQPASPTLSSQTSARLLPAQSSAQSANVSAPVSADNTAAPKAAGFGNQAQTPREARLQVQLESIGSQILLTLRALSPAVSLPLQQRQLVQLLLSSPEHQLSAQSQKLSQQLNLSQNTQAAGSPSASTNASVNQSAPATGAAPSQQWPSQQWSVQLRRQQQDWQLTLPGGESVQIAGNQLPALAKHPGPLTARLVLNVQQQQLSLQLQLPARAQPATAASAEQTTTAVALRPAAVAQLVPALARQQWPERLQQDLSGWLAPAKLQAPPPAAAGWHWHWQLKMSADSTPVLELAPQSPTRQLRLDPADFSRPLQFNTQTAASTVQQHADARDLWRQLLPLSAGKPDPLADVPELPPAVRQLLQEIRSQLPDPARQQNAQQLMQQINAALQFSPLQLPAQPNSAAGTMAIAIQLLLGRLGAQLPADRQPSPQKDKLAQVVGQLDRSQSAQLLRQLSGHSSALQGAQIANLEQQGQSAASRASEQQLFIQLPLLQQGQSSFAELAVSEREADGSNEQQRQRCWVLTMKFDLGNMGELLVKVQLSGKEVSLQFYADQAHTVAQADQFLPLFKDRLKMQGLQLADVGCQLGKIPQHLYQQGTSLLQVRV